MPERRGEATVLQAVLLLAGLLLLWRLRDVLLMVFGAVIVAALLRAFSDPLTRATRLPPRLSVLVVAIGLVLLLAFCIWALGEPLARQLQELRTALPRAWA